MKINHNKIQKAPEVSNKMVASIQKKCFDMKSCLGVPITKKESFDINNENDYRIAKLII